VWIHQSGSRRCRAVGSLNLQVRDAEGGRHDGEEALGVVGVHPVPSVVQEVDAMPHAANHVLVLQVMGKSGGVGVPKKPLTLICISLFSFVDLGNQRKHIPSVNFVITC